MSSSEASKPYIDATERSIELNFRSLEYQNDRLNKALSRNERMMHQRVWKMKTFHDLEEPKTWQSRSDLQTYLGALAVMGRQKGGGRVFSKEKHSYFDHDDSHTQNRSNSRTAGDEGDEDEDGETRMDRAGKKAEHREEEKLQHEEQRRQPMYDDEEDTAEDEAEFSVPLGASADISTYINERLQSRQRERTIDISAPPTTQHPSAFSTRASVMMGGAAASYPSFLSVDEHKENHFSPRRASQIATPGRSGTATPSRSSPPFHSGAPRSPSVHTPMRFHATPASMDAQAHSLVTAIHFHHSEQMRQMQYTGGKQLVRRTAAVVEGKNLFAGLKDKFHNTFTEIREMAEEDAEEKRREERALNKRKKGKNKQQQQQQQPTSDRSARPDDTTHHNAAADGSTTRRPATTAGASTSRPTARPTLPSASGFRPATSAGLIGRQSSVTTGAATVERRTWPDTFVLPESVDTFTRLAPIVRLPRQGNVADTMQPLSLASKPTSPAMKGAAARRSSVSAPAGRLINSQLRVPAPITTGDLSALGGQMDEAGSGIGGTARGMAVAGELSRATVRPLSVYKQQQHAHMRANFIRFLSHTEPQLWTPTPPAKRREGEQASGRDRGKSRGMRASVIQTHSSSSTKAG